MEINYQTRKSLNTFSFCEISNIVFLVFYVRERDRESRQEIICTLGYNRNDDDAEWTQNVRQVA